MVARTGSRLGQFGSLTALIHGEQLGHGHKFEPFREERIKDLGHRFDRGRMDAATIIELTVHWR
jgi:hypothetical protein